MNQIDSDNNSHGKASNKSLLSTFAMECFYIFLIILLYLIYRLFLKEGIGNSVLAGKLDTALMFIAFGTAHIVSSNLFSYLYSQQKALNVLSPTANPVRLKILGVIVTLIGVLFLF